MRRLLLSCVLVLIVAGCGSSPTGQQKKDIKQIEPVVFKCLPKGSLLTSSGRHTIASCISPPGHKAAFERCATPYLSPTAFVGRSHRDKSLQSLFACWEHNR